MTGVYEARKKSGEIYYRASFTYKNKHISLGSSSDEASCHAMYNEACEIINNSSDHWIDTDHRTTSYNEAMTLSLSNSEETEWKDCIEAGRWKAGEHG